MPENPKNQASIISIISEMVKSGESEENIIKMLQELGIEPKNAKRLLLLGEADTFALLQNEINKMVKEAFEKEKPKMMGYIKDGIEGTEKDLVNQVEKRALSAFKEDQHFIENQATMFQARLNQSVKNIVELNNETKRNIADLGGRISNNEREMWSLKERIFGSKIINIVSTILIALEVGLVAVTGFLFFTGIGQVPGESLLVAAIVGVVLATMVFLVKMTS